jgi:hypothetical protein
MSSHLRFLTVAALVAATALAVNTAGTTFYVAPGGNDAVSCTQAQNTATPKRTIANAAACLSPGSTLYVRAGTYPESLFNVIPSGASWDQPVTIAAFPGETVTLRPLRGDQVLHIEDRQFIVVDGFILDAVNVLLDVVKITYSADPAKSAHHIRIQNSELMNSPGQGLLVNGQTGFNEFINLKIHDNGGTDFHHGVYISNGDNLIERSLIYANAGWGLQLFGDFMPRGNIVRNNTVHSNARAGARGPGIGIYGFDNHAYNNVVYGNAEGVQLVGGTNNEINNNTIVGNNRGTIGCRCGVNMGAERGASLRNNIIYQHSAGAVLQENTVETVLLNNLIDTDPRFVDASAFNFRLLPTSPAINAGVTIGSITADADGVVRPQAGVFDIGAYEYDFDAAGSKQAPKAPRNLRIVRP